ncbi:YeeE/YedE thiosulfate transporter family protein [Candidatus Poribacteria bacterium]
MLKVLHSNKGIQLIFGLVIGVLFGFLLQKGGVTKYSIIIGQLLLEDFTVVKIMLSAVITGTLGIHFLRSLGLAQLHPKPGSLGSSVVGGLIFGVGFATLGYCPGTISGAVGQGSLDALLGGVMGILLGAGIFAASYPKAQGVILNKGDFGELTLPKLLKVNAWIVVIPVAILLAVLLFWLEKAGL